MRLKLLAILPAILLLALFLFLFPRFYFNQLEHKNRQVFSSIEEARSIADNYIEQRSGREGGVKSNEEVKSLSDKIATDLNKVGNLVNEHESILSKQSVIVFLLPSKYKEYYNLKKEVFNKYYSSLRKFQALKEYESGIMDVLIKKDEFSTGMLNAGKTNAIDSKEMNDLINAYGNTKDNIKKYFDEGFMTQDYYDAMLADINANTELFNLFKEAVEKKYTSEELQKRIAEINSKYEHEDFSTLYQESYNKITTVKQKEWSDLYNQADELTYGALDFYDKNRLADDPLSVLLSKLNKNYPKNITLKNSVNNNPEKIKVDLNGDGAEETLILTISGSEEAGYATSLIAYDNNGKEIGRLPEGMPIAEPLSGSAKVYTPVKKDKNQFVSYDFVVGPHSSETMFFGLFELETGGIGILPVCLTPDVKNAHDCLFWSGEVGTLVVDDFDKDGVMEVVEMVDEYPKDGVITSEIENMINEQFKGLGQDAADGMIRIAKREQGGRGKRVVWGIHRYNGEYFEEQLGANYEKYYKLIDPYIRNFYPNYPTIMRKGEMSKDSLEYNEFMRSFWTRKQ